MFIKKVACGCVMALAAFSSRAQQAPLQALDSFSGAFIKQWRAADSAQSFITTDKAIYSSGETLWFRVFLLQAIGQKIQPENGPLFIDLVNENDSLVTNLLLNAGHPQRTGRIVLPDSLATGYYWLRAYTRQMAADSTAAVFAAPVYIVNTGSADPAFSNSGMETSPGKRYQPGIPALHFFPEGGTLITGATSTVAF